MKYIENSLFSSFSICTKDLAVYRIIFCLYVLLLSGLPTFSWLSNELNYFFNPPEISIANLFNGFPSRNFFIVLSCINVLSFFFTFWGLWTNWSSIIFSCSYLLGSNFGFSFGKIDHGILLYITPLFLGIIGWGRHYSIDNWRNKIKMVANPDEQNDFRAFIVSVFALIIGFGFFSAGIVKLIGGWWKWDVEAVKYQLYDNYYAWNRVKYLANYFLRINNHFFWKSMDYLTLIFELGIFISVINNRLFRYFLATAVVFHCLVLLMFNISFATNLIVYLLFIDWRKIHHLYKITVVKITSYRHILKLTFVLSALLLLYWTYSLFISSDVVHLPPLLQILFAAIDSPAKSRDIVFLLSVPVLLFLLVMHFRIHIKRFLCNLQIVKH